MQNTTTSFWLLFLAATFFGQSCTTPKPVFYTASEADYNQRRTVKTAQFKRKINVAGISVLAMGAAGGAYLGDQVGLVAANEKGSGPSKNTSASMAAGGVIGFGVASLANFYIAKQGRTKPVSDAVQAQKWVRNFDRNSLVIGQNGSDLTLIRKQAETGFVIKDIADARDFKKAFPNSTFSSRVTEQCARLPRRDLPEAISLFGTSDVKLAFLNSSGTVSDLIEGLKTYPSIHPEPGKKALSLVRSMDDVRRIRDFFKKSDYSNSELEALALAHSVDFSSANYFAEAFPSSTSLDDALKKAMPGCTRSELSTLIDRFPKCRYSSEMKRAYIASSPALDDLLAAAKKYPVMDLPTSIDFSSASSAENAVSKIGKAETELGTRAAERFQTDVQDRYLKQLKNSLGDSKTGLTRFIEKVENEKWLQPTADGYLIDRRNALNAINYKENLVAEELDDINKYVEVVTSDWAVTKGDGLSFWEHVWSSTEDLKKYNVFVVGHIRNTGDKPKKVLVNVAMNYIVRSETRVLLFFGGKSEDRYSLRENFYVEVEPGEQAPIAVMFKFSQKSSGEYYGLGSGHNSATTLDTNDPYKISLSYFSGAFPSDVMAKQSKLIDDLVKNGRVETKKGYESSYKWSSDSHKVSEDSKGDISVKKLTSSSTPRGYISIYSRDNEKEGTYSSQIFGRSGKLLKSFNDAYDDNSAGDFPSSEFPLRVVVSYISKYDSPIHAEVTLQEFSDYDLEVKD